MEAELVRQGKLEWAQQEFAAIVAAPPAPPRVDPVAPDVRHAPDHTTGGHWPSSASCGRPGTRGARRRDVAPHRILPDSAIVAAAAARPTTIGALTALPVFSGRMQRRNADLWLASIGRALAMPGDDAARRPASRRRPPAARQMGLPGPGGRSPAAGGPGRAGRAVRAGRHAGGEPGCPRIPRAGCCGARRRTPDRCGRRRAGRPRRPAVADRADRTGPAGRARRRHRRASYPPVTFALRWQRWLRTGRVVSVTGWPHGRGSLDRHRASVESTFVLTRHTRGSTSVVSAAPARAARPSATGDRPRPCATSSSSKGSAPRSARPARRVSTPRPAPTTWSSR